MKFFVNPRPLVLALLGLFLAASVAQSQWITRDHRWPTRGPWMWALPRELPELYREFNGIDFGHAHIAETLLRTQDFDEVEQARLEVLEFIFSRPAVPPDEAQVAPTFVRMAWEAQRAFELAHNLHRSLYDLFAADHVVDKEAAYYRILGDYLSKPEAITPIPLDHHGALWNFPESRAFHEKFRKFNTQIWAYHWLQAAAYDVQLMGDTARQRDLFGPVIEFYHGYLREPPVEWDVMPMMMEGAPEFSRRFPEAAAVFDNLHMLHDNINDVLASPELFPTHEARRERIVELVEIYLNRNHVRGLYGEYRAEDHEEMMEMLPGPRPPSAWEVLGMEAPEHPEAPEHHGARSRSGGASPGSLAGTSR